MNSEENKDIQAAPGASPVPTPAQAPTDSGAAPFAQPAQPADQTPSLDEIAAELSSPDLSLDPQSLEAPIQDAGAPNLTPTSPDLEPAATTAAPSVVAPEPSMPEPSLENPSAPVAPEATTMPEAPAAPEASTVPTDSTAPETPEAPAEPQNSFADFNPDPIDAKPADENATESSSDAEKEEEPLVPADPVPGSIGSAFAYSPTAPNHSVPVTKPKMPFFGGFKPKKPKTDDASASVAQPDQAPVADASIVDTAVSPAPVKKGKDNLRLILIIGIAVVLIAVVAVILLFVINGSSNNKTATTTNTNTNTSSSTKPATPTVSSLTCSREGGSDVFAGYGNVVSGSEEIILMYSNNYLSNFGSMLTLDYDNEEDAQSGMTLAQNIYRRRLDASNLTADPFDSDYNTVGNTLTVSHQADGDQITAANARVLGFYVVQGEVADDIDTLSDNYESDGYSCVEK